MFHLQICAHYSLGIRIRILKRRIEKHQNFYIRGVGDTVDLTYKKKEFVSELNLFRSALTLDRTKVEGIWRDCIVLKFNVFAL